MVLDLATPEGCKAELTGSRSYAMFPGCFIEHARVSANVIHAVFHDLSDLGSAARTCTGWAKKVGPQTHDHNAVKS